MPRCDGQGEQRDMQGHDIIVIGASAGGVEAIPNLLKPLPQDLAASIFVVLHVPAEAKSFFPQIIQRHTKLRASHAEDGQRFEKGCIYVAPPDRHLCLEDSTIRLVRGPKENRHRPAVDPLFRSAARSYRGRVVGVVLTGSLDDGTEGLQAIKQCGGTTVVQDPDEASMPSMPLNALRYVEVDHVLTLAKISPLLVQLARRKPSRAPTSECAKFAKEMGLLEAIMTVQEMEKKLGAPTAFICPDCNGPLWETKRGKLPHYRCLVGHAFSPQSLLAGEDDAVERALWSAVKSLEERASLLQRLATRAGDLRQSRSSENFLEQVAANTKDAEVIRGILKQMRPEN